MNVLPSHLVVRIVADEFYELLDLEDHSVPYVEAIDQACDSLWERFKAAVNSEQGKSLFLKLSLPTPANPIHLPEKQR